MAKSMCLELQDILNMALSLLLAIVSLILGLQGSSWMMQLVVVSKDSFDMLGCSSLMAKLVFMATLR